MLCIMETEMDKVLYYYPDVIIHINIEKHVENKKHLK